MIHFRRFTILAALIALSACSSVRVLAPTPNVFANGAYPQSDIPAAFRSAEAAIFYVTDRVATNRDGTLSYSADRSSSMAFGASTVAFGQILRFDATPIPFEVVNGTPVRLPSAVASYNRKRAVFQDRIRQQMRAAGKNEVTIFVHGFNNSFEDAVFSLADIWHFSGRRGVPIAYSWPAGSGGLFGYFTDRESGEFTVYHLKEFLLQLSQIPELKKIHIVAHSRGTDVTTTALREMIIAVRSSGKDPKTVLKIENLIMAAPDLDFSVVRQRLIAEGFGAAMGQITVYMNRGDTALGISQRLMAGLRFGKLTAGRLENADKEIFSEVKTVNFVNVEGVKGLTGHAYYRTNRNVFSDIGTIIRQSARPGSPARPLIRIQGNFWNMPTEYPN
jgi:esterase/lipase superfamily enzyme